MTDLVFQEPPLRGGLLFNGEVVAALRARPGEWAIIKTYQSDTAIKRVGGKNGAWPHPSDIELRGVIEAPGSVLYARHVPPGEHVHLCRMCNAAWDENAEGA